MEIKSIKVGYLETNCYILTEGKDTIIIDPGDDYDLIVNQIKDLKAILITHSHPDHIGALDYFKENYDVPIYDYYNLEEGNKNIDNFNFFVLRTPGHKEDSLTYIFEKEKVMFTGDFLFKGTIGRTDLETGNIGEMIASIRKIKEYDDSYTVYPGHGDKTTLGYEKNNNPFFK